jgi:preprotein translocase subunit SecE
MSTIEQVKPVPVRSTESGSGPLGWWQDGRNFLTEVRNEMKRVTWPGRKEVYATTIVVIITSAFFGLYLFGLDILFNWAVNWIFSTFGAA